MICGNYVAFDLETTGLSPSRDRILEIGAVKVEDGDVSGTYETLICHSLPIPEQITELTEITEKMTAGAPELSEAVEGFLAFSGDAVLIGHNLPFDYSFMKQSVTALGGKFERTGLDTLAIARVCLPEMKSRALDKLAARYGIPQEHHHRALDDALTTARLYERLREEFGEKKPDLFAPRPLLFRARKESPVTNSQKAYLRDLMKYHRIESNVKIETLTKSEASRLIDRILSCQGRPEKKKGEHGHEF